MRCDFRICLSAWFRRDIHLPPLLPQSHQLSKRNDRFHGVPVQERQSEFCLLLLSFLAERPSYAVFQRPGPALTCTALCAFMQPLIDCAVCYKTLRDEIEPVPKPYAHCVHKTTLTQVELFTKLLWPLVNLVINLTINLWDLSIYLHFFFSLNVRKWRRPE